MKRPIYEKKEDRKRQAKAISEFVNYLHSISKGNNVSSIEAPLLHPFDYEMTFKNKPWALVEVKCRTNAQNAYDDYMIGASKIQALIDAAKPRKLSAFLLVSWFDKIGFADAMMIMEQSSNAWGGRYDRNDPADNENVLHIPLNLFTIFKNKKISDNF